ncbi:unnamed protein product, partial [Cylindrotheca closterium]
NSVMDLDDPEANPDDIKALQAKFKKEVLGTFKASAFFYNCDRSRFQRVYILILDLRSAYE